MVPILAYGAMVLVGYLIEQKTEELRAETKREKRRLKDLKARRSRIRLEARALARGAAIAAATKMIGILKAELNAAKEVRNRLPWGSPIRERAQDLVLLLTRRINKVHRKQQSLHADNTV
jgi:hypothetical protein